MAPQSPARVIVLSISALALLGGLWWLNDLRVEHVRREAQQRERAAAQIALEAERARLEARAGLRVEAAVARTEAEKAHAAVLEAALGVTLLEARGALLAQAHFDVLERMARTALEPYESRADEALSATGRRVKGAALALLSDVLAGQGHLPEAAEAAAQTLALARLSAAAEPGSASTRHALARAHAALGAVLALRSDHAGALAERREALAHLRALNEQAPESLGWLGALADTLADASRSLAALGRLAEARAHAEEAVTLFGGLRRGEPTNPLWPRQEARALQALAAVALEEGAAASALVALSATRALLAPLLEGGVKDPGLLSEQADLLLAQGGAYLTAGNADEAQAVLRGALSVAASLASDLPTERRAQERLAQACEALCSAFEAAGDLETAVEGRAEAVSAWRRLAALPPEDPAENEPLLLALLAHGDLLLRLSRPDEALPVFQDAADLALAQVAHPGVHPVHGSDLAECYDRLASTQLALGRRAQALETWRSALAAIEPLAKKTPENAFFQADLARIWWHLGLALLPSEPDRPDAERALRRALRYLTPLEDSRRLPPYAASWPDQLRRDLEAQSQAPLQAETAR